MIDKYSEKGVDVSNLAGYIATIYIWFGSVNYLISTKLGGVVYIGFGYLLLIFMLFSGKFRHARYSHLWKAFFWLCFFALHYAFGMELFYQGADKKSVMGITISLNTFHLLINFPVWLIGLLSLITEDSTFHRKLFYVFLIGLVVGMVATLWATSQEPNYVRYSTTGKGYSEYDLDKYRKLGAKGFELTYSASISIPIITATLRRKHKLIAYLFLTISIVYVLNCSLLLAIMALIFNFCLASVFLIKRRWVRNLAMCGVICVGITALRHSVAVGEWLINFSKMIDDPNIAQRLVQLGRAAAYGDTSGDALNRLDLYARSINGILKSPVIGMLPLDGSYAASGHSTLLDLYCTLGLPVVLPVILVFWNTMSYSVGLLKSANEKGWVIAAYITFLFITAVNPVMASPQIVLAVILVVPLCSQLMQVESR